MMANPQNTMTIVSFLIRWIRRLRNVVPYRAALAGFCATSIVCSAGAAGNLNIRQAEQATQQEAIPLELGKPIERELTGGHSHAYEITRRAGQSSGGVRGPRGIGVPATPSRPEGNKLSEVDSPNGTQGPEPLKWIVETAGIYRLEVRSLENDVSPARYEAKLVELRAVTDQDRDLAEADKLYNESYSLLQ